MRAAFAIALIALVLGLVAACGGEKKDGGAADKPAPAVSEKQKPVPLKLAPLGGQQVKPTGDELGALREKARSEALKTVTPENAEQLVADLEKQIDADLAELEK